MLRPGVRVPLYLPSRSTTQACCWGTTLMDWLMNTNATMSKIKPISMMLTF